MVPHAEYSHSRPEEATPERDLRDATWMTMIVTNRYPCGHSVGGAKRHHGMKAIGTWGHLGGCVS